MEYIEKLQMMQSNSKNLENLSKEELIQFINLLLKMGISQGIGNQYADELTKTIHQREVTSYQQSLVNVVHANLVKLEHINYFEVATGIKFDSDFIDKLCNKKIILKEQSNEQKSNSVKQTRKQSNRRWV